jgi:hypothetical protein
MSVNYRGYTIVLREDYLGFVEAVITRDGESEPAMICAGVEDDDTLASARRIVDEWDEL